MVLTNKSLASSKSLIIDAVVSKRYSFASREDAVAKLASIEKHFVTSTHLPEEAENKLLIWIRDYAVTKKEKASGYMGNYALIFIEEKKGKFTSKLALNRSKKTNIS